MPPEWWFDLIIGIRSKIDSFQLFDTKRKRYMFEDRKSMF